MCNSTTSGVDAQTGFDLLKEFNRNPEMGWKMPSNPDLVCVDILGSITW
jgi:hypothetical protein